MPTYAQRTTSCFHDSTICPDVSSQEIKSKVHLKTGLSPNNQIVTIIKKLSSEIPLLEIKAER
jgi:hypothetical protein